MTEKACARCERTLPLTAFRPDRAMRLGVSSWCRECSNEATKRWQTRNPGYRDEHNARRRIERPTKVCPYCGEEYLAVRRDQVVCSKLDCKRARARETYARRGPRSRRG